VRARSRLILSLAIGVALFLGVFLFAGRALGRVPASASNNAAPQDILPDLDQEAPSQIQLQMVLERGHRSYRLGFRSAVRNLGNGPLILVGARADRTTSEMKVDQMVERVDAPARVIQDVGRMRYVVSPDHRHWHYLDFDRYSLQTYVLHPVGKSTRVVKDQKTGFCLGDRYPVTTRPVEPAPAAPVYTGRCGLTHPELLGMREGISVGYGDDYSAFLEGQDLPLDGLPDGRYVLVHRVNADHGLKESTYANNAASVLLDLEWHQGEPYLSVLATCPNTAVCGRGLDVRAVATSLEPDGRALVTERTGRDRVQCVCLPGS
jgi:lysyl oxidase